VELIRHEPGWRLPRRTELARRHNVSATQVDAAVSTLASNHLVRRLPDGRWYRLSPAEYLIPLAGAEGMRSRIDPVGAGLTCRSRHASWHQVPADLGRPLRVGPGEQMYVVHAVWAAGGQPAAYATTYLPAGIADALEPAPASADATAAAAARSLFSLTSGPELAGTRQGGLAAMAEPASLQLEMQPPAPWIARRLRLSAGQPAAMVTARFGDPVTGRPAALTVAVLRPDLVRISVHAPDMPPPGRQEGAPQLPRRGSVDGDEFPASP
jgi:DNA-binding GntR family transcriptional regulator